MELIWPGVPVTACASMRPRASNTPAARSPDSRTMVEKAVRCSAWACSSTTAIRRFHMICLSIRLTRSCLSMLHLRHRRASGFGGPFRLKPIDALRRLSGDQPIAQVGRDQRAVALPGIADAATARRHDHDAFARLDQVSPLRRQRLAGLEPDITRRARLPPVKAARRKPHPLERAVEVERLVDAVLHLDDLPETTAHAPRPAGVRAILLAPDDLRRHRFEDLDRSATHATGKTGRRQAVPKRQRAHATGRHHADDILIIEPWRARPGPVGANDPEHAGAFGGHAVLDRL